MPGTHTDKLCVNSYRLANRLHLLGTLSLREPTPVSHISLSVRDLTPFVGKPCQPQLEINSCLLPAVLVRKPFARETVGNLVPVHRALVLAWDGYRIALNIKLAVGCIANRKTLLLVLSQSSLSIGVQIWL
jgi:hypothetical protein